MPVPFRRSAHRWALIGAVSIVGLFLAAWATAGPAAAAPSATVLVARVDGPITPVTARYVLDGLRKATDDGRQAYLVELDTPGGLDTSMREIIRGFLGADVPVIVYVSPPGSRAASAGALITFAAHVAVMAPGTTIGAATPVDAATGDTASAKVVNDAAAYAESVARERGRDVDFAVATVREGRAVAADEAQRIRAVDLIAGDRASVLSAVDGRSVTLRDGRSVTLRTAQADVVSHDLGVLRRVLALIAEPNIAFLFLSIGTLALIYELATPGMGLGGVAGAVLLIAGLFGLSVLPVNVAGIALLVLAGALFLAEVFAPGIGVFAAGGTIALAAAGLFLFDDAQMKVSLAVLIPTVLIVGIGTVIAGRLAWRARKARPQTGLDTLRDATAVVRTAAGHSGQVLLQGSWWSVRSPDQALHPGQTVRVVGTHELTLIVRPVDTGPPAPPANPSPQDREDFHG